MGRKTLSLNKKFPETQKINLNEQQFQFIQIKVKNFGDFVVEKEISLEHFKILPGLYNSKNGKAIVAIERNSNGNNIQINLHEINFEDNYVTMKRDNLQKTKQCEQEFRDSHMNTEEKSALRNVIKDYKEILYDENDQLTFTHKIKHTIRTADNIPIHTKSYKYPKIFEQEVQTQVKKMLRDGIIKESISPYTSPVWVVPKKSDASGKKKFRLVIDYRKLNEKTISDKYPIPDITDILDKLGRAKYFSTIDLVSGFHQIQLNDEDTEKTAFSINSGKYEFTRMPFGLKNAPATFQRIMDCILRDAIGIFCFVYMDDIIIFSPSIQEHQRHLRTIFKKLKDANLKVQLDKCEFFRKEVQFLGHTVTEDGVKPNNDKIEVIKLWPVPKNEKEVRQFLGILGYYRRFIKDFAKVVKPLTSLLRKETDFEITPQILECFNKCKMLLTLDPILIYPDFSKEFVLTTDASDFAIGAVLSQGIIGKDRPVAYASRTLNKTEEKFSTTEKELLAIVWAVKYFRPYLYGRKFKLFTDHQPLTYSLTNTNNKLVRWKLALEEFDYEIIYKPGKQNIVADALSRIKTDDLNTNSQENPIPIALPDTLNEDTESDNDSMVTVHSADTSDDYYIWTTEKPINSFKTQVIFRIANFSTNIFEQVFPTYHRHIIVRPNFTEEIITEELIKCLHPKKMNCIKAPVSLLQLIQETYRKHFATNRTFKVYISETLLRDVTNPEEQDEIIKATHTFAHRGIKENKSQILQNSFFPEIERKLKIFVNFCDICKKNKYDRKPPKLLRKSYFGEKPFDIIHIDIFFMKQHKWLTIVDSFSKFANIIPINSRTIIDLKQAISEHIRHFGRPNIIVCDQEPAFLSIDFIGFLNDLGINIHFASNSNSNGKIERFHSTLIELFRTLKTQNKELTLNDQMNIITDIYNNTFHSVTNKKPRDLIFNTSNITNTEEIKNNFDKLQSAVKVELNKRKQQYEQKHVNKEHPKELNPNEIKYIKNGQRLTKDKPPFKITTVKENNDLTFTDKNNIKIHKNRIKS